MPIACNEIIAGRNGKAGGLWKQTAWVQLQFRRLQAGSYMSVFKLFEP